MNKFDFLNKLNNKLSSILPEERKEIIDYYTEYFIEAGEHNEENVIKELGNPVVIANQYLSELAIKESKENPVSIRKGLSAFWIIILGIFALPIGVPLVASLAFALVISAASIVLSLYISSITIIIAGIFLVFISMFILPIGFPTGILTMGIGGVLVGLGILLIVPINVVAIKSFTWISNIFSKNKNGGYKIAKKTLKQKY